MKGSKKAIIIAIILILLIAIIIIVQRANSEKTYVGEGFTITVIGNKKVTVTTETGVLAENAKLEKIPAPKETVNLEEYSRFVKVNIQGGDVIAGFSKDGKTIDVSGVKYTLVEK